jgi:hypothetical protein
MILTNQRVFTGVKNVINSNVQIYDNFVNLAITNENNSCIFNFYPPRNSAGSIKLTSAIVYYTISSGSVTAIDTTLKLYNDFTSNDITISYSAFPIINNVNNSHTITVTSPNFLEANSGTYYSLTITAANDIAYGSNIQITGVDWIFDEVTTYNNVAYATRVSTNGTVMLATGPTGVGIPLTSVNSTGSYTDWSLASYGGVTGLAINATGTYQISYGASIDFYATGTTVVGSIIKKNGVNIDKSQVAIRFSSSSTVTNINKTFIVPANTGEVLTLWLCANTGNGRARLSNVAGGFDPVNIPTVTAWIDIIQIS